MIENRLLINTLIKTYIKDVEKWKICINFIVSLIVKIMIKSRILIVEDEVIVSKYIEACLSNLGYEIAAVITYGEEAVQNTEIINPDLILMDVRLSGKMNGTEAAAQISQKMDVPIVFLTAYTDEKTIDMAKDSDPYGYLVKPFYEKELQTTLEMALHKHEKFRLLKKERDLF